ncbi:MAG: helix-turn-helix transcriptional regulator [Candidatus Marinimicrobia bacterium]|nr:helix-turn-helix transcriptional regulator [Candidatus Neomarinimicrobiota bacterium]
MVALFIGIQLYYQYRFDYLRSNIFLTIGYLLIILFNSIASIIEIKSGEDTEFQGLGLFDYLTFLIIPLLMLFVIWNFQRVMLGLVDQKISSKSMPFFYVLSGIFVLVESGLILFHNQLPLLLQVLPMLSVQIFFYVLIFKTLIFFKRKLNVKPPEPADNWLQSIFYSELSYFLIILTVTLFNLTAVIKINLFMMLTSFAAMIINPLLMFLFVKYHNEKFNDAVSRFEKLCTQFAVTDREKEILSLVCQGKTNKEIGEILFLSPLTVRDHLSNIFRKVGVSNRTKLATLFQ